MLLKPRLPVSVRNCGACRFEVVHDEDLLAPLARPRDQHEILAGRRGQQEPFLRWGFSLIDHPRGVHPQQRHRAPQPRQPTLRKPAASNAANLGIPRTLEPRTNGKPGRTRWSSRQERHDQAANDRSSQPAAGHDPQHRRGHRDPEHNTDRSSSHSAPVRPSRAQVTSWPVHTNTTAVPPKTASRIRGRSRRGPGAPAGRLRPVWCVTAVPKRQGRQGGG